MITFPEKYRPKTVEQLCGEYQRQITQSLLNLKKDNQLPQLIFFSGQTGVGKTTISKILAEGYDYQHISCRDVGVGYIRDEIIAKMNTFNIFDKQGKKVYLLDEVDALSNQAQQSLLVKLENLPNHIHIIVATKDPQKLRDDFLGRFSKKYHLKTPSRKELINLIFTILSSENVTLPKEHYETFGSYIIDSAKGSVREIVINIGMYIDGDLKINYEQLRKDENIPKAILNKECISKILSNVTNFTQIHVGICNYMFEVLKKKPNRNAEIILKNFTEFHDTFSDRIEFAKCLIKCYEEMS